MKRAIEFETAVALDRNNAHALLGLGQTLMFLGRPADGIPEIESSLRLDPRDPNIAFGHWSLGSCHLLLGHMDKAADLLRKGARRKPAGLLLPHLSRRRARSSRRHRRGARCADGSDPA